MQKPQQIDGTRWPFLRAHKKKLFAAALIVLAALVFFAFDGEEQEEENIRFVTVEIGTVEEAVTAQGKLEPKEYVDVGTQVSGQLRTLHVEIGDDVKEGDLLAEIDPRIYEAKVEADTAQLKSLTAQLAEQQANLALARQLHARNELLIKSDAISKQEFDESAASLKSAAARVNTQAAQIEQVESTLKADRTNLGYTKIFAPISGTVATLPAKVGQTLNASQTAPILMQLANLDVMTIRAQVAEADIMRLKPGMKVHFTTLGNMERGWNASVRQILPSPELINDVVLYNVLIDVDNKDRALMNGMSTQVFFSLGQADNVPVIPMEALGTRVPKADTKAGPAYKVRVRNGRKTEEKIVHIGLSDRVQAEVREGVKAGDQLVVEARKPPRGGNQRGGGSGFRGGGPRI